jgi:transcriptional regulator with XRE-family HTH domain
LIVSELAREMEQGRLEAGLTYEQVGRAAGLSRSQVSRVCRGIAPDLSITQAAELLAVVGLELSARAYPAGPPIRDAAQVRLLARLRSKLSPTLHWRTEVPLQLTGDLRAWDARIDGPDWHVVVEAETRLRDLQALMRKLNLKCRDGGEDQLVLLLGDTRNNRELVKLAGAGLIEQLPGTPREVLRALATGSRPGRSGIVFA